LFQNVIAEGDLDEIRDAGNREWLLGSDRF
jgi:hypothetical protein